ncbi:hypothetical protein LSAT2_006509 [Lamellibrachia satsuma]|nr:hypothetical protein LSAT2_006509 [Lamellibrachia satsuma]
MTKDRLAALKSAQSEEDDSPQDVALNMDGFMEEFFEQGAVKKKQCLSCCLLTMAPRLPKMLPPADHGVFSCLLMPLP